MSEPRTRRDEQQKRGGDEEIGAQAASGQLCGARGGGGQAGGLGWAVSFAALRRLRSARALLSKRQRRPPACLPAPCFCCFSSLPCSLFYCAVPWCKFYILRHTKWPPGRGVDAHTPEGGRRRDRTKGAAHRRGSPAEKVLEKRRAGQQTGGLAHAAKRQR